MAQTSVDDLAGMLSGLQINIQQQLDRMLEQRLREFQAGSSISRVIETNFSSIQRDNQFDQPRGGSGGYRPRGGYQGYQGSRNSRPNVTPVPQIPRLNDQTSSI